MDEQQRGAKLLAKYKEILSAIVLIFLAWAFYQAAKIGIFWCTRTFGWDGPDIEAASTFLSLPLLVALWRSHDWVMRKIDKVD